MKEVSSLEHNEHVIIIDLSGDSGGSSGGVIAGVVVAVLFLVIIVVVIVVVIVVYKRRKATKFAPVATSSR